MVACGWYDKKLSPDRRDHHNILIVGTTQLFVNHRATSVLPFKFPEHVLKKVSIVHNGDVSTYVMIIYTNMNNIMCRSAKLPQTRFLEKELYTTFIYIRFITY